MVTWRGATADLEQPPLPSPPSVIRSLPPLSNLSLNQMIYVTSVVSQCVTLTICLGAMDVLNNSFVGPFEARVKALSRPCFNTV